MSKHSERIIEVNHYPNPDIGSYEIDGEIHYIKMSDAMDSAVLSSLEGLKEKIEIYANELFPPSTNVAYHILDILDENIKDIIESKNKFQDE